MFFWNSLAFWMIHHVGNLISGSSAFSKISLNIWKFTVHVLLKPSLEYFGHYFTSMWRQTTSVFLPWEPHEQYEKAKEPARKWPTSAGSLKKQESSRKNLFLLYWLFKDCDCEDHNKLWKILKEMGIPDHITCFLRNLYVSQESTMRT